MQVRYIIFLASSIKPFLLLQRFCSLSLHWTYQLLNKMQAWSSCYLHSNNRLERTVNNKKTKPKKAADSLEFETKTCFNYSTVLQSFSTTNFSGKAYWTKTNSEDSHVTFVFRRIGTCFLVILSGPRSRPLFHYKRWYTEMEKKNQKIQ